ncbi:MAG: hypothetical protein WKF82_00380 [Nocardioidaceae bacterium]
MPRVLFPAVSAKIIGGGATTVGILKAGIAVGSVTAGLLSGPLGHVRRQGLAVLVAVIGWAAAVFAFGIVLLVTPGPATGGGAHWMLWVRLPAWRWPVPPIPSARYSDRTILQSATPDAMRGRLQGVFIMVVAGGPRLGDLVLGAGAELTNEAVTAMVGGFACIAVVLALAFAQPEFARYDAHRPTP